jgi:hypothetical protein
MYFFVLFVLITIMSGATGALLGMTTSLTSLQILIACTALSLFIWVQIGFANLLSRTPGTDTLLYVVGIIIFAAIPNLALLQFFKVGAGESYAVLLMTGYGMLVSTMVGIQSSNRRSANPYL